MGPVTIAVDSYGPVTDNAQSVFELSLIESLPNAPAEIQETVRLRSANFEKAKHFLEENDGVGNTFKATAKPVLIGTAVVGATTMIFSIIVGLTHVFDAEHRQAGDAQSALSPGADWWRDHSLVYRSVDAGGDDRAYRAVEFIKANMDQGEHGGRVSLRQQEGGRDRTKYAQKGMFKHLPGRSSSRALAFAFVDPYFFTGYLISIAVFGLYQAIFWRRMPAGRGITPRRSWSRSNSSRKGTELQRGDGGRRHGGRSIQGHIVGGAQSGSSSSRPFASWRSRLTVSLNEQQGPMIGHVLAAAFSSLRPRCSCGARSTGCGSSRA